MGAVLVANLPRPGLTVPLSDETGLPEWSGKLGGVQRWRSPVAWVLGASQFSGHLNKI
jgi:hypothetical protein